MNLLCPNCQNQLSVSEQNAGQLMKCPFCSKYFSVPALPPAAVVEAGSAIPRQGASQGTPAPPSTAPSLPASAQSDAFAPTWESATPQTVPPRQEEPIGTHSSSGVELHPSERSPPPPPATGYEHMFTIWISPRVVSWIAPVALAMVVILMFFPWTCVCPGGYAVYSQSALQMIWGGYTVDPAGEKVLGMEKTIDAAIRANWLMAFYLLLILAALVLAVFPSVQTRIAYPLPRAFQQLLPWRILFVLIITLLALLILFRFQVGGSGFENAVIAIVQKGSDKEPATLTAEEQIERALRLSRLNLSRTFWLDCALFAHLLALAGAGLELWLQRRGARPLPRMDFHW